LCRGGFYDYRFGFYPDMNKPALIHVDQEALKWEVLGKEVLIV